MQRRGGRLLAISVDSPADSLRVVQSGKLSFPILSDADRRVIQAYGVVHSGGGPRGEDIAMPSMFLVDRSGKIVWEHVARRVVDRPSPEAVIAAIRSKL